MITDEYGRCGITQQEAILQIRKDMDFSLNDLFLLDGAQYISSCKESYLDMPNINIWEERAYDTPIGEFHKTLQEYWLMPEEYKEFDIEAWLLSICSNKQEIERVNTEISLYKEFNLINLLRYLKYLKDLATKNNIVWGVGRGSSCCSYILFLMKIHRVDPIKYQLDIKDFLRKE